MRRARTAVAITAAILTGGALASPVAHAHPADADSPAHEAADTAATDGAISGTVVLPTGDQVTVLEDGTAAIEPAEGREDVDFVTPTMFDGSDEIIAVPVDKVADIEA